VELYKRFIEFDKKDPHYAITLVELYFEVGRDAKTQKYDRKSLRVLT